MFLKQQDEIYKTCKSLDWTKSALSDNDVFEKNKEEKGKRKKKFNFDYDNEQW
jgi:hypothetical protein